MSHATIHDPDFDLTKFRADVAEWAAEGAKAISIEWQTGPGPTVAWFPSGERTLAGVWHYKVRPAEYNEQYADYLEYRLTPLLAEIARGGHLTPKINCVDQQPVVIQRQRRRELEHAAKASGHSSAAAVAHH